MIGCYDLALCPPTYDVVAFLALAELERIARGEAHLDIRILPGPAGGFRAGDAEMWPYSVEERVRIRDRVLVPLCHLLPSVRSVAVASGPGYVDQWGNGEYHVGLPNIVKALRAGSRPLRARTPQPRRRLITFTLRQADHHELRNSREEEWRAAALELIAGGWDILVLRDTARAYANLPHVAEVDIYARARIYASATLNVGISNGPMWMAIFMDVPTLMLRPTTNEAGGCYDDAFFAQYGVPRGSQLPTSPYYQRLVWEEDTRENILGAVQEMLEDEDEME